MEDTITQQLDDKDMECVNVLKKIGLNSCTAKTLVALVSEGKTQLELTGCTGENQSSISIALRKLIHLNYVDVSDLLHKEEKGRPKRLYTLRSWDSIVDMIEKKSIREITEQNAQIERLKELIN
jgi:predicted transcriptional regulator